MALEKYITEITDILRREIRSFEAILELLILEEKCLVECDREALVDILGRQEDIFSSIACLEKSRAVMTEKIASELNIDPESINISLLSEKVDGTIKRDLTEAGHVLARLNEDIQKKKVSNTMLINQSILLVESDIRMILNSVNGAQTDPEYTSRAKTKDVEQSVCIDQRL